MSTNPTAPERRKVVIAPVLGGNTGVSMLRILPIWVASTVVHLAIILLAAMLFTFLSHAQAASPNDADELQSTTQIEEPPKEFDLTDTNIGDNDPMLSANNVDRIEEVVVPGMVVNPLEPAGIPGALEGVARYDVPPPPGVGNGPGGSLPNLTGAQPRRDPCLPNRRTG